MKKTRLTIDEHRAIGADLKNMHDRLTTIAVQTSNAFPQKSRGGTAAKILRQMIDTLGMARSELEEQMGVDHPDVFDMKDWKDIYYGSRE